ncbi:uncharacterized protein LOC135209856 [Macrobrachium nipponense]|uniref:uncharacterized protein LOC135209856 n=1 Tax=Macrobrachium nipponense TaxID=159736 RepID=UPI0030C89B1B
MTEISPDQGSSLKLPEHNHVWIALWNKNKTDIEVRFSFIQEYPGSSNHFELTDNEGWWILSISTDIIFYGNRRQYHWVTQPQGRNLRILTNHQLNLQEFPMPLEPQETSKLPAITTGKYTGTTTIKPQVPPTGNSPVKPEDSPTGTPVSTLIIICVVVAVLVVAAVSFLCYRCCFRKENDTRAEGKTP